MMSFMDDYYTCLAISEKLRLSVSVRIEFAQVMSVDYICPFRMSSSQSVSLYFLEVFRHLYPFIYFTSMTFIRGFTSDQTTRDNDQMIIFFLSSAGYCNGRLLNVSVWQIAHLVSILSLAVIPKLHNTMETNKDSGNS